MSKADEIYNKLIEKIHIEGEWDKGQSVRTKYADGTPAYAKSIFGVQVVFEEGEIPLVTSKKVFTKMASKEMFLFWQQQTVKEKDFKSNSVKVWDEWFNEDGNLGKSYAYQFESRPCREAVKVKKKIKQKHNVKLKDIIVFDLEKPNDSPDIKSSYVGRIFDTKDYGSYIVLDAYKSDKHPYPRFLIQFLETGYKVDVDRASVAHQKNIKDVYKRYYFGVGYIGDLSRIKNFTTNEIEFLYHKWYYMLARCYKKDDEQYKNYGEKGVFVDERWHSFENYLNDIRYVPQYFIAKQNDFLDYDVDKDYYGANYYGKDSCVWVTKGENLAYRNNPTPIYLIKPNGDKEFFLSYADAEKAYNLSNLNKIMKGERKHVRNYTIEVLPRNEEYVYRYKLSKNQVVELLHNIKHNPASRRLMTSFWNYEDVNDKVLQECAWATNWNVRGDNLDLILIQRSADAGLGLIFNWIQYYFLQCLIANVSGLKVGRFIHQIGSLHYYDRHEEALLKQIKLDTYDQPDIIINKNVNDFMNYTPEDVQILNYECGEYIKMEVAI